MKWFLMEQSKRSIDNTLTFLASTPYLFLVVDWKTALQKIGGVRNRRASIGGRLVSIEQKKNRFAEIRKFF